MEHQSTTERLRRDLAGREEEVAAAVAARQAAVEEGTRLAAALKEASDTVRVSLPRGPRPHMCLVFTALSLFLFLVLRVVCVLCVQGERLSEEVRALSSQLADCDRAATAAQVHTLVAHVSPLDCTTRVTPEYRPPPLLR